MAYPTYLPGQAPHRLTAKDALVLTGATIAFAVAVVPIAVISRFKSTWRGQATGRT